MISAKDILKEKGYVAPQFDTSGFMQVVAEYFLQNPVECKLLLIPYRFADIKRICRECGIAQRVTLYRGGKSVTGAKWQMVTTHTGRHTFATLLFLRGVDITDIANMMGHVSSGQPNINMTFGYICARKQYGNSVLDAFA